MKTYKKQDEKMIIPCVSAHQSEVNGESAQVMTLALEADVQSNSSPTATTLGMHTYSWADGVMTEAVSAGESGDAYHILTTGGERMYMTLELPTLPRNPRIKRAELVLTQNETISSGAHSRLGLYTVTSEISTGECTPTHEEIPLDLALARGEENGSVKYSFDITQLLDRYYRGELTYLGVMLKYLGDEPNYDYSVICSSACSENYPELHISYESSYGVNTSYRAHSHDIGSSCRTSVDIVCGNLMLECEDIAWAGGRMPVSISHLYNSALSDLQYTANDTAKLPTADFSAMKLGLGFKLGLMQSMCAVDSLPFDIEDEDKSGFVYLDESGREVYFKKNGEVYEDIEGSGMSYCAETRILTCGSEKYHFDEAGRLVSVTDEHENTKLITYTDGRITKVTDGVGREFILGYTDGYLSSITAPDQSRISYTYIDDDLSSVTYPDGKRLSFAYTNTRLSAVILYQGDEPCYKVTYQYYSFGGVYRVAEYGVENGAYLPGSNTTYDYSAASNRTVVAVKEQSDAEFGESDTNVIKIFYTFDEDGEVVSEYSHSTDTGNVGSEASGSGINPIPDNMGYAAPVVNLLRDHSFDSLDSWSNMEANDPEMSISLLQANQIATHGRSKLRMVAVNTEAIANGVYQSIPELDVGEYTFSAYVKGISTGSGEDAGVYLRVTDTDGNILSESERVGKHDSDYVRVCTTFTLTEVKTVNVQILADGKCGAYIDSAQLERGGYAREYNLLTNGSFISDVTGWCGDCVYASGVHFDAAGSLLIRGDIDREKKAYQDIPVNAFADIRETFTLSCWVRSNGIPTHEREGLQNTAFRIFAEVHYLDGTTDEQIITADGCYAVVGWQYLSCEIAKGKFKTVDFIRVGCEYSYNFGKAYFDGLTLTRTGIETGLSADDFVEYAAEDTDGEYISDADTEVEGDEGEDTAPAFEELTDSYGNALTETTSSDGEFGTIYRAFGYTENGNDLIRETDARGNTTEYTVNGATSRNETVTDRMDNVTEYEYDGAGRTTCVTSKDKEGDELAHVEYAYDSFDNMTEIVRGDGMKYVLSYNAFHNLESIGIDGKGDGALVTYAYKTGNGRLKAVTYANGDTMRATYNSIGQMIAERWFDVNNTLTAYYKYTYDTQGNIVRSIDMTAEKEYNYMYENGTLVRSAEYDITIENELVTKKTLVSSVRYSYDSEGTLTKKRITHADGTEQVIYCETNDGNTVIKFTAGGKTVTSHSKTDSFGRKVFDELQLGTGFVSRQFAYFAGDIPEEHKDNGKVKSAATTNLVSQIILSDGRTISYEYDEEERITKVTDSVDGTYEYTYDSLGQLLTETVNGVVVNTMTYDNYGNILTKNGKTYTYGDTAWKDKLTAVGNDTITYDAQGNPTSYLGHTLTWEKGRQLKSFTKSDGTAISYTYNANGIRTSKTIGGIRHDYTLDGAKILREAWYASGVDRYIIPLYDNEDSVCGINYCGTPFYFLKNLQGDVIAITDKDGEVVARYQYDAWGVCTIASDTSGRKIATVNPYRYRSYYYDAEIGMYYLQSRYYNPVVGRFVNGDEAIYTCLALLIDEYNIFTYCDNSPIESVDPFGYFRFKAWILAAALDSAFAIANCAMMAGYFTFSATIMSLSKSWFTLKYAKVLFGTVTRTFVYGIFNTVMTLLRTIMWRVAGVTLNFLTGYAIDKALGYLGDHLSAVISSLLSWGGLIAGMIDWVTDKSLNGWIVI